MLRALMAILLVLTAASARADETDDRFEGYYYPPVNSTESFGRSRANAPTADRAVRVTFVTQLTKAMLNAPDTPPYVLFAKGADADRLILIGLDDEMFKTLYRARAVLAQLTSNARGTEFFIRSQQQTTATFFDLLVLLGFKSLVVSDGERWAHKIVFEANQ
jgi:hypothetical protein